MGKLLPLGLLFGVWDAVRILAVSVGRGARDDAVEEGMGRPVVARAAQGRKAQCEAERVGVDLFRGYHTRPTAGAPYIGKGGRNGDQGGCEAD